MPAVIANYRKQETLSRLKKAYTTINQALKMSEIDNGEYEYWEDGQALGADVYLQKYWLPYFNVTQICNNYSDCGYESSQPYKLLNGTKSSMVFTGRLNRVPFVTADGIVYSISVAIGGDTNDADAAKNSSIIYVDINASKAPNTIGKDLFLFQRVNGKGILPHCHDSGTNYINTDCSKTGEGNCCAQKIIMNGWQFPKDYPYK